MYIPIHFFLLWNLRSICNIRDASFFCSFSATVRHPVLCDAFYFSSRMKWHLTLHATRMTFAHYFIFASPQYIDFYKDDKLFGYFIFPKLKLTYLITWRKSVCSNFKNWIKEKGKIFFISKRTIFLKRIFFSKSSWWFLKIVCLSPGVYHCFLLHCRWECQFS